MPADKAVEDLLKQILRVLSIQVGADKGITERARLLKLAGLDNATIADILDTTPEAVRTYTSNLRRTRLKRGQVRSRGRRR